MAFAIFQESKVHNTSSGPPNTKQFCLVMNGSKCCKNKGTTLAVRFSGYYITHSSCQQSLSDPVVELILWRGNNEERTVSCWSLFSSVNTRGIHLLNFHVQG
ncbi:hypothetical protein AVEN_137079-1 [Araneus ventricosus]|uniref:Uncharacterized protein n=1 Tax=Araneus ventricosus TaxID=182803 RepID=A0A4Y2TTY2_ARAVE|nr:hypothetical protein AVEN_46793-1 [Araneus ventricosus]GBO02918.1 hypothetical protein AVEN_137079-1 [Araneus ventricosus]